MSNRNFLLRFDDICSTMNWGVWKQIEAELVRHSVRPILAVVPDNRDPNLVFEDSHPDFWGEVRRWQEMGFTIALHGYQHVYVNDNPGIIGLTRQSEFAGLAREEQRTKLSSALAIFSDNGVKVEAWVAPSHSFDGTTVEVLREMGVRVISDGLWPFPFTDTAKTTWIPQQLWTFRPKGAGIWTVCQHHNRWTNVETQNFIRQLAEYSDRMTTVQDVITRYASRRLTLRDRMVARGDFIWNHRIRPNLARFRNTLLQRDVG